MEKLSVITVCHMLPEIIAFSLVRGRVTMGVERSRIHQWVMVDNHWPIHSGETRAWIHDLAMIIGADITMPDKNLGGHGGFNFGLKALGDIRHDDLILCYDPDSNPLMMGWLKAMLEVMDGDRDLGYLSLMDNRIVNNRNWSIEEVMGHRVAFDPQPEMMNVTIFRGRVLKAMGGMPATRPFYGGIEAAMHAYGFKSGYLMDYREDTCPIPHDELYRQWKNAHADGAYGGNFDRWVEEGKRYHR